MKGMRFVWLALALILALGGPVAAQGLGVNRGIDHVGPMVRLENFEQTGEVFTDQLGFSATPALLSPLGAKNRLVWFEDQSYLEILTITEVNDFTAPFAAFLESFEGAAFYGSEVTNVSQAMAFLTGAGYGHVGPVPAPPLTIESTGQVVGGSSPLWNSIILTGPVAPGNSNFFVDYDEAQVQQMFIDFPVLAPQPHANTAKRIDTLFLVVADLDAAIDFYEGLGLEVRFKNKKVHYLGARGAEVSYRDQTVALLVPDGPGLVADFAAERGEGILGVSIEVGSLQTARALINGNTGLNLQAFKDKGRSRFLIPASLTHGFLIEMVE
ncbi:MAG TPA: VOC family protein [Thermoanaerobaculia bacterium]|nr:VOC family protein [Thermoanaerobaculia bacterium]